MPAQLVATAIDGCLLRFLTRRMAMWMPLCWTHMSWSGMLPPAAMSRWWVTRGSRYGPGVCVSVFGGERRGGGGHQARQYQQQQQSQWRRSRAAVIAWAPRCQQLATEDGVGQASAGHCPPLLPSLLSIVCCCDKAAHLLPSPCSLCLWQYDQAVAFSSAFEDSPVIKEYNKALVQLKTSGERCGTPAHTTLCLSVRGVLPALQVCSHAVTGRSQLTLSAAMCMPLFDRSDFSSV